MIRVRKRVYSGSVLEQYVYNVKDGTNVHAVRRPRFKDAEQYEKFKDEIARKRFAQLINANYTPESYEGVLTFDNENEIFDFDDARRVRSAFVRRIRRRFPDVKMIIVMGRGKSTARIHFHFLADGADKETLLSCWTWGKVVGCEHLRKNCVYKGVDHGRDYSGIANYFWDHWTKEQGGHHYYATRNHEKPHAEEPEEIKREYTVDKPPRAPKGYVLVEKYTTPFGYLYFKYSKILS